MKNLLLAAVLSVGTLVSGTAKAAILEFDVSGVFSSAGSLGGSFLFDTSTQSITDINVIGGSGFGLIGYDSSLTAEASLIRDGTDPAPFDFTSIELYSDASHLSLLRFDIGGFQTVMPGLAIGATDFLGVTGIEIAAGSGSSAFIDSTIVVTRLADPGLPAVPLPPALPMLAAGIGLFGIARRKQR
ncbi:hypothetical protein [Aestuariibius sp. HNIBRBA575]|uniref:hypothetical protein n=1 Tax=Aestuariibius sp. HNIBRBA575 TaxID=3233343 RepID=UPI0034A437EE